MKKIIITAAALSAMTTSVYASKARILALGDATEDNYFVEDSRRIFTNAAQIHNYKNQVFLEWGSNSTALETDHSPKAMGGFLMESGNLVYGAYLGNESNISSSLRVIASNTAGNGGQVLPTADNQLDLFLGGKMGDIKWGADFIYSKTENEDSAKLKAEDNAMALKLGAMTDMWEGYVNLSLKSDSKVAAGYNPGTAYTSAQEFDGKFGIQVGGSYKLSGDREVYATVKKFDWDQKLSGTNTEGGFTSYRAGFGKRFAVDTSSKAFVRAYYENIAVELETKGTAKAELKNSRVPLVIGYEAKANSWLTLRGSVSHNLIGTAEGKNLSSYLDTSGFGVAQKGVAANYHAWDGTAYLDGKKTIANSTEVNAGASLNFGKLTIDGFIGTTTGHRGDDGDAATNDADTKAGILTMDNLLTRVGMTYSF